MSTVGHRNIEVGFLCLFVVFLTSTKILFDLFPLIQFIVFEEKSLMCPSEEVSIHFEEMFSCVCSKPNIINTKMQRKRKVKTLSNTVSYHFNYKNCDATDSCNLVKSHF